METNKLRDMAAGIYSHAEKIELIYVGLVNNYSTLVGMTKETRQLFEFAYNFLAAFEPQPCNHVFAAVVDIWWFRMTDINGDIIR